MMKGEKKREVLKNMEIDRKKKCVSFFLCKFVAHYSYSRKVSRTTVIKKEKQKIKSEIEV